MVIVDSCLASEVELHIEVELHTVEVNDYSEVVELHTIEEYRTTIPHIGVDCILVVVVH